MKSPVKFTTLTVLLTFPLASFAEKHRFNDYANVTEVSPVYQTFEHRIPEENCWVERVRVEHERHRPRSATSTLVGGVIGGAIGHAVGNGSSNKKIGAVVGSMLGMSVGNDIGRRNSQQGYHRTSYEDVERCETTYRTETEERLSGYDVSYKYRGESYTTFMPEHPGKRIKVSVSLSPVRNY